jgi:hypothetical protein
LVRAVSCTPTYNPHQRTHLAQILELLETTVLLTAFDNPVGDVHQNGLVGLLGRQGV